MKKTSVVVIGLAVLTGLGLGFWRVGTSDTAGVFSVNESKVPREAITASAPIQTIESLMARAPTIPPTPFEIKKSLGDAPSIYDAVMDARASGNPDSLRLAARLVTECVMTLRVKLTPTGREFSDKIDPDIFKLQQAAAKATMDQCAGFKSMTIAEAKTMRSDMERQAASSDTLLARLDAVRALVDQNKHLSADDKNVLKNALNSGDKALIDNAMQSLSGLLSDVWLPVDKRPDFWYLMTLVQAYQQVHGLAPLYPDTKFVQAQSCVTGFVCIAPDGSEKSRLAPIQPSAEQTRIRNAYVAALKGGTIEGILAVK